MTAANTLPSYNRHARAEQHAHPTTDIHTDMDKSIKKYIYAILGGILPAALLAACASDGPDGAEPQGTVGTPLEFIASGLSMSADGTTSSRSAWLEVDTGGVAIQTIDGLRKYIVSDTLDGATALLTSSNPFKINAGEILEVIGRFPNRYYPVGDTIMWTTCHLSTISDDLLLAYSYDIAGDGRKLDFYHTQAKVVVNIRNTPYIKNLYQNCWHVLLRDIDQTAEYNVDKTFRKITLELIKSYNTEDKTPPHTRLDPANTVNWGTETEEAAYSYETIIVAQKRPTKKTFITMEYRPVPGVGPQITHNIDLSKFVTGSEFEFKSGYVYTFNITINGTSKDDVEVTTTSIPWGKNGNDYSLTI